MKVGLFVRIPKEKKVFYKGYKTRWTAEIFKIKKVNIGSPTTYDLKDLNGEDIRGVFYRQELNPVPKPKLVISTILDKKKDKYLVRFKGSETQKWVRSDDIDPGVD